MYHLEPTTKFKKDLKKIKKAQKDFKAVVAVLKKLELGGVSEIPKFMLPHKLKGKYKDNWEYHIQPDLLIIWFQVESPDVIKLIRIGSHSELFK
ncbi:type II toxin-antitoxin system YafQ family toxin [Psychroflexus sp. CAK57W]|uniref:type II toxin-antitoxin system mRNA interferase toxin, RelE/StbE family n=1 Tax=Psychroflexus curvus TaxID=2873595 RepID=UPI001CCD0C6C|nr:type II toxin-antitoxin system mRNA interferase toxin, RelE/StbE family [Psychroflexus curvus]MBZ9787153.1 type II toxin-antitoxin system YafQ family toxin [Psychroflexus curvus]